eukprot:m.115920 g.115920  ORF g.115920 m.115920 type:complete len:190 (+) comp28465_c0_seq2:366-935(+)
MMAMALTSRSFTGILIMVSSGFLFGNFEAEADFIRFVDNSGDYSCLYEDQTLKTIVGCSALVDLHHCQRAPGNLDLSGFGFQAIQTGAFDNLPLSCKEIYLNDNDLGIQQAGSFGWLPHVNAIYLHGNPHPKIPANVFNRSYVPRLRNAADIEPTETLFKVDNSEARFHDDSTASFGNDSISSFGVCRT